MMKDNLQKGVSLLITFLIMTTMLTIVLSVSTTLFAKIKQGNLGNSLQAYYAAQTGVQKTLYLDQNYRTFSGGRGFCSICNNCGSAECVSCKAIPLAINGCNVDSCTNCQITYTSVYEDKSYAVDAKITPSTGLNVSATGTYKNASRTIEK